MNRARFALPALLAGLALGCAKAEVKDLETKATGPLPKPPLALIYDFAVSPKDVDVDRWGLNDVRSQAPTKDQLRVGEAISRLFADALVQDLNKRSIKAQRGVATTPVPLHAVRIEGVFVTLREGDDAKRTMIGFGYGASKAEARVSAYQQTSGGKRFLGQGSVATKASRKPGSVASLARGSYFGLAFKVAAKGAEKAGAPDPTPERIKEMKSGLEGDIRRGAQAVSERIEAEYRKQGWL
jgi:hypothetical protein